MTYTRDSFRHRQSDGNLLYQKQDRQTSRSPVNASRQKNRTRDSGIEKDNVAIVAIMLLIQQPSGASNIAL